MATWSDWLPLQRRWQLSVPSGTDGAERLLLSAFALIRVGNLTGAVLIAATQFFSYRLPGLMVALLVGEIAWSSWLIRSLVLDQSFRSRSRAVADVLVATVAIVVLGLITPAAEAESWTNWMFPVALSAVIGAGMALSWCAASSAALALLTAHLAGAMPGLTSGAASFSNTLGNSASYGFFLLFGGVLSRQIRASGQAVDDAATRAVTAEATRAAEQSRHDERIRQYRRLHDTVLATLTLIARGTLDHQNVAVRERAGRDAAYLRQLIDAEGGGEADTDLAAALAQLVGARSAEGMTVHWLTDTLDRSLNSQVIAALLGATAEALTNVAKHLPVTEAWLTATTTDGVTTITVRDRGPGFAVDDRPPGRGLDRSIIRPVRDCGGTARIDSAPAEGTLVELTWPG